MEMTKESLYKYFRGDSSEREISEIETWLRENPENRRKFNEAQAMFVSMIMAAPKDVLEYSPEKKAGLKKRRMFVKWIAGVSAAAACAALIATVSVSIARSSVMHRLAETMTTVSAPAGQCINITLQDGTEVWLNSGTSIEYPARFGKQRRVKVDGEALFDVAEDVKHPFIVNTYACDVKVLGTKFNVLADKSRDEFCTSLLRGRIQVTDNRTGRSIVLSPEQSVTLRGGNLVRSSIENHDDLMWNEGIISLHSDTFSSLMEKFEKAFGVRIDVEGSADIQLRTRGKVRVAEGITHALEILENYIGFTYNYDIDSNVVTITLKQ